MEGWEESFHSVFLFWMFILNFLLPIRTENQISSSEKLKEERENVTIRRRYSGGWGRMEIQRQERSTQEEQKRERELKSSVGLRLNHFHAPDRCLGQWGLQCLTAAPEPESSIIGSKGRHTDTNTHRQTHPCWHQSPSTETHSYHLVLLQIPLTEVFTLTNRNTVSVHRAAAYLSPLTGLWLFLTASVPGGVITDVREGTEDSRESSGFIERANDPSIDGGGGCSQCKKCVTSSQR